MTARFKIFLIAFLISLPLWWGANLLEASLKDSFYWNEIAKNPQVFTAQIAAEEKLQSLKPFRNKEVGDLELIAKSAMSYLIKDQGGEKILFEKNTEEALPIASLTKLMTAKVVLENYDLSKEIKISKEAIDQEENFGKLIIGKVFPVEYLLYPLLMESSNDTAFALANDYDGMTEEEFIEIMNFEAKKINLENTFFVNTSGLDPDPPDKEINYSTANDLAVLTKELLKKDLIWEILSTTKFNRYGPELVNTNKFLYEESLAWQDKIVGGKTGYTDIAGGCMILVTRSPKDNGYLINVILGSNGSNDKFLEMQKLVNWLQQAYEW